MGVKKEDIELIKETVNEFLSHMTMSDFVLDLHVSTMGDKETGISQDKVHLDITMPDPKFLIGQNGKTLIELERILKIILNKKLQKNFYFKIDINDYQKKKIDYLKNLARESADEVSLTKKDKILPPLSPYERRIIHIELEDRKDIITQSQGSGLSKSIIISPSDK